MPTSYKKYCDQPQPNKNLLNTADRTPPHVVIRENTDSFARVWEQWFALDVRTGAVVATGKTRWDVQLKAQAKGYEEETTLARHRRR